MSKIYIFLLRSDGKQLNINKGLTKVIMILYMQQGRTLRGPLKTLTDLMYSTVVSYIFPRMEEPLQLSWWAPTSSSLLYTISRKYKEKGKSVARLPAQFCTVTPMKITLSDTVYCTYMFSMVR